MGYRIQNRRDTAARWAEMNPILLEGEIGLVTDNANQYKVGDGIHAWNDLPLRGFTGTISQELGEDENAVVSQKVVTEKLVEADGKLAKLGSKIGEEQPRLTWVEGYIINKGGVVQKVESSTVWSFSNEISLVKGQTISFSHGVYIDGNIVAIAKKNDDNTYTSLVQGSSVLVDYEYTATDDCIVVITASNISNINVEVHYNLIGKINKNTDDISRMMGNVSANEGNINSLSGKVEKRARTIVVSAFDSSEKWKNIADFKAEYVEDGISVIVRAIELSKDGDIIILSDGTFKATKGNNTGVEVSKSVTIIGQGMQTFVERNNDAADITVDYDNVHAVVKGVNVRHAVNIASKTDVSRYESSIYLEDIYVDGVKQNCEELNYILNSGYATIAASGSKWAYYATTVVNEARALPIINNFTYNVTKLPDSTDVNKRTVLLLPAKYEGTGGVEFNKSLPTRLIGLVGHERETIIKRTDGNIILRQVAYCSPSSMDDSERCIENLSFCDFVSFVNCSNFRLVNCYRNGIKVSDFYSDSLVYEVGKDKIYEEVSHAVYVAKRYASLSHRAVIKVYGTTYESTLVDLTSANIDIEGYQSAKIIRVGANLDEYAADSYRAGYAVMIGANWDGYFRNIDVVLAGCQKGIDLPAIVVKAKKARLNNVKAFNLSLPSVAARDNNGNNVLVCVDSEHRIVRCTEDENSTTGYTAHVYSKVFGTEVSTYECTFEDASKTHNINLTVRKPDADMSSGWEDSDGGRRHGIELYLDNDCDVILENCEGYGSPWGFHNTRGIYVLGSPKLINCIGVGGGIGHRNHGILCHDNSEAELIGCIGVASPFAYLTPENFNQHGVNYNGENSCGIKFQRMSASKLTNCIGYGNDMPKGHGIHADMRTFPKLYGCIGYIGGGEDSAGLCLTEYATIDASGGYYGKHTRIYEQSFKANDGNGMVVYPYKRPTRRESNENDVLFGNHWALVMDNTTQPYTIENVTFTRGKVTNTNLGGTYLKLYDISNSEKRLIASEELVNEDGGYQYVNIEPYLMESGHKLYIVFEQSGIEQPAQSDVIKITLGVSESANGATAVNINQYWSHEVNIDALNPKYKVVRKALLANILASAETALKIGTNASLAEMFNITNSTLQGKIVNEGSKEPNLLNCSKLP